jgi:hypothetical protein
LRILDQGLGPTRACCSRNRTLAQPATATGLLKGGLDISGTHVHFARIVNRTHDRYVGALCLVTCLASRDATVGPIVCLLVEKCVARGSSAHRTRPWPQCRSSVDDRPFVEAANSCSTRTVRRRDGWRSFQTASGPPLFTDRWPNSTGTRYNSESTQFSITLAHPRSSAARGKFHW